MGVKALRRHNTGILKGLELFKTRWVKTTTQKQHHKTTTKEPPTEGSMKKSVTLVVKENKYWGRPTRAKNPHQNYVIQYLMRGFKTFFPNQNEQQNNKILFFIYNKTSPFQIIFRFRILCNSLLATEVLVANVCGRFQIPSFVFKWHTTAQGYNKWRKWVLMCKYKNSGSSNYISRVQGWILQLFAVKGTWVVQWLITR